MRHKYWRVLFKTTTDVGYTYRWIEARNKKGYTEKEVEKWADRQLALQPEYMCVEEIVKEDK